jgi:hypothetical protein
MIINVPLFGKVFAFVSGNTALASLKFPEAVGEERAEMNEAPPPNPPPRTVPNAVPLKDVFKPKGAPPNAPKAGPNGAEPKELESWLNAGGGWLKAKDGPVVVSGSDGSCCWLAKDGTSNGFAESSTLMGRVTLARDFLLIMLALVLVGLEEEGPASLGWATPSETTSGIVVGAAEVGNVGTAGISEIVDSARPAEIVVNAVLVVDNAGAGVLRRLLVLLVVVAAAVIVDGATVGLVLVFPMISELLLVGGAGC